MRVTVFYSEQEGTAIAQRPRSLPLGGGPRPLKVLQKGSRANLICLGSFPQERPFKTFLKHFVAPRRLVDPTKLKSLDQYR